MTFTIDLWYNICRWINAGVMELADVPDSKSGGSDTVSVRPRPPAPKNKHLKFKCLFFYIKAIARKTCGSFYVLFKEFNSRLKHHHVVVTLDIFVKSVRKSFRMSHFSEYMTVGRSNSLDSRTGIIGVVKNIRGRHS